jgi:hypothetical protein
LALACTRSRTLVVARGSTVHRSPTLRIAHPASRARARVIRSSATDKPRATNRTRASKSRTRVERAQAISSLFDSATFAILLWAFNANATLRSGWFVDRSPPRAWRSSATAPGRVPFFRSRPSKPLLAATTLVCVAIGVLLPFSPLADTLGFTRLPAGLLAALAAMIPTYLLLLELGKRRFYRIQSTGRPIARPRPPRHRRIHYRASRWSIHPRPHARRYGLTVNGRIMSLSSCSTMWQWWT